ncbi:MAG TPA: methyltransferase domain-containing protein [Verrucomicrobiae bacterium]|nr:methyltransferase domain-containing protein [Verrucomicrobiae bacterium]
MTEHSVGPKTAPDPFDYIREWDRLREIKGWWHSFELPDGTRIEGVSSLDIQKQRIEAFDVPQILRGKRVLDIGTWDGWFAFEMERRGADVVAIDCWDNPRFREMHSMLSSRVEYRHFDMYELTPERIGKFDIVLFMGVLYHLKHPLLALERVCALTTDFAAVESFILRGEHRPGVAVAECTFMEFYETDELGGQTDNWCGPTLPCLLALCRTAGFARVQLQRVFEFSACVACHRSWLPPEAEAEPGPLLLAAHHNMNYGINFESRFDEYVTCSFQSPVKEINRHNLKPEVGGFGVNPIKVESAGPDSWRAHFKLPPGLCTGWHNVRLRVGSSRPSNEKRIALDLRPEFGPIVITGVADGHTWKPNELDLDTGDVIVLWIEGLPENSDLNNVRVFLESTALSTVYVGNSGVDKTTQVNAQVRKPLAVGPRHIHVEVLGTFSAPVAIKLLARS